MKIIIVEMGNEATDQLLHQTIGSFVGHRGIVIISATDLMNMQSTEPIKKPCDLQIELKSLPQFKDPIILKEVKPFHRTKNKYQNKRRNRRH